jgi:hypothetical protein
MPDLDVGEASFTGPALLDSDLGVAFPDFESLDNEAFFIVPAPLDSDLGTAFPVFESLDNEALPALPAFPVVHFFLPADGDPDLDKRLSFVLNEEVKAPPR